MLALFLENFDNESDRESFTRIYRMYENYLIKVSKDYLYDTSYKVDCMQETFLQLIKTYETFRTLSEKEQKKYLITICRRCAYRINEKNSSSAEKSFDEITQKDKNDIAYFDNYPCEKGEAVAAIKALDFKYRLPIILKYSDGYSVKEISAMLDISENLVLQRLYRGRKMIIEQISSSEENENDE